MATQHQAATPGTCRGTVKFFDDKKGWGFILVPGNPKEIFVHYKNILARKGQHRTLNEGDEVEFEITDRERGPAAVNVLTLKLQGK